MALPYMNLYWSDLLADTMHLGAQEFGAYVLLLGHQWQYGSLPDDPVVLARIARIDARQWHKVKERVLAFFDRIDGRLVQKRLQQEREKAASKVELRRAAGALGGKAKALKNKKPDLANAKQMLKQTGSGSKDSPSEEPKQDEKESLYSEARQKFDAFWAAYPLRQGRVAAYTGFFNTVVSKQATANEIIAGAERYAAAMLGKRSRYIMQPGRWLEEGRWQDEYPIEVATKPKHWADDSLAQVRAKLGLEEGTTDARNDPSDNVIDLAASDYQCSRPSTS